VYVTDHVLLRSSLWPQAHSTPPWLQVNLPFLPKPFGTLTLFLPFVAGDGQLYTFGDGRAGALGHGTRADSAVPILINVPPAKEVAAGSDFTLVLTGTQRLCGFFFGEGLLI
jgi:hypothetical protein